METQELQNKYNTLKAACLEMFGLKTKEELADLKTIMEAYATLGHTEAKRTLPMINALLD